MRGPRQINKDKQYNLREDANLNFFLVLTCLSAGVTSSFRFPLHQNPKNGACKLLSPYIVVPGYQVYAFTPSRLDVNCPKTSSRSRPLSFHLVPVGRTSVSVRSAHAYTIF